MKKNPSSKLGTTTSGKTAGRLIAIRETERSSKTAQVPNSVGPSQKSAGSKSLMALKQQNYRNNRN